MKKLKLQYWKILQLNENKVIIIRVVLTMVVIYSISVNSNARAFLYSNPFWMPLEFDLGKGYFKSNVFILGLKSDTGLVKICVTIMTTKHELCHYMNAPLRKKDKE